MPEPVNPNAIFDRIYQKTKGNLSNTLGGVFNPFVMTDHTYEGLFRELKNRQDQEQLDQMKSQMSQNQSPLLSLYMKKMNKAPGTAMAQADQNF